MNLLNFVMAAVVVFSATQSFASGCGGLFGLEEGAYLEHKTVRGSFSCRDVGAQYLCSFYSETPNEFFVTSMTKNKPPTHVVMDLGVDVFEAVMHDDCTGEEVPGILNKSYMAGTNYDIFIPNK